MLRKEFEELKAEGLSIIDISLKHNTPIADLVKLSQPELIVPEVIEEPKDETEQLKDKVHSVAVLAVNKIEEALKDRNLEALDLTKLTDSVTKLHTTFFKADPATTINIQTTALSSFRGLLKE